MQLAEENNGRLRLRQPRPQFIILSRGKRLVVNVSLLREPEYRTL
jgi:hypothetical protein